MVSGITGISSIRRAMRIQIYEFNGQRAAGGCYLGARRNRILQSISDKALARIELKHIFKIGCRGKRDTEYCDTHSNWTGLAKLISSSVRLSDEM